MIINGNSTCITPIQASKLLFDYKDVGIIVYGCNVSSSESNYVNQTLLLVLLECIDIKLLIFLDYAILIGWKLEKMGTFVPFCSSCLV